MRFFISLAMVMGLCAAIDAARGQDFVRTSIPGRWIEPLVPEDLPPLDLPDYIKKNALDRAKAEEFAGRYKLSLLTIKGAKAQRPGDAVEIALVRAGAMSAIGKKTQALAVLEEPAIVADARVVIARARLLDELGRQREAIDLLKKHIEKRPDSIAGHYYLGQICETIGDQAGARAAYAFFEPFVDKWQGEGVKGFENAEDVTLIGRGLDRFASLNSLYQTRGALHNIILNMFIKAYDVIDRSYWPAHVAAAEYYLSHDDEENAQKELKKASAGNPQDIRSLALLAHMAVGSFNFDAAEAIVSRIKRIDASSIDAELIMARNLLQQRRPKDAEAPVRRVLQRQPQHLQAMGLLAAVYALQLQDDKTAAILKEVDKIDPRNATAYFEVAQQLGAMRQYPRAAAMYKIAIDRAPWWNEARNGLGLLYTQSGDEDAAGDVLEAARQLDPFNYATTNYMRLLDDLRRFAKKETAHFVIMYDANQDPVIPEYFGDYLESIYKQVCGEYHTDPPVKTYIEVFPTHDAFSVRTTGSPWIGTVGASTGRVIALVAPRKGSNTMGTYNWAQVLRHEFTHTVTLAATDNRIAHWMTEGLAVLQEHSPLRWEWVPMLYMAVTKHQLFTMDNLTWGFVRPKRPIDRQLAYAESFWICKYIEETYGHDAILKMLAEFRLGKSQDDVFPMILKRSMAQFQQEFFAWCDKQVASWGYDAETSKKYKALTEKGEQQIKSRQFAEAVKTWEKISAMRPVDALPHQRLAGLYLLPSINQPEKAAEELTVLHKVELKMNLFAKRIARLYRDMDKLDKAVEFALQAVYIDPYDMTAHELLAELYEKMGNADGLAREKRVMPVLAKWLEENRKKSQLQEPAQ